jgi:hypothetical protein
MKASMLPRLYTREFTGIFAQNGIIELRFKFTPGRDAMIQAVEVLPFPQ